MLSMSAKTNIMPKIVDLREILTKIQDFYLRIDPNKFHKIVTD